MKKDLLTAIVVFVFTIGLIIAVIGYSFLFGFPKTTAGSQTNSAIKESTTTKSKISIKNAYNAGKPESNKKPGRIDIICVDGSAFLHVYSGSSNAGGPAVTRYPEKDATCPQ